MFYVFTKKNITADSEETLEEAGKEISTNKENICFEYISQPYSLYYMNDKYLCFDRLWSWT